MKHLALFNNTIKAFAIGAIVTVNTISSAAVTWSDIPTEASISAIPMTMLVAGKDHKMFYEAYNDASDIDGDGTLDIRFKPSITYYGLFNSKTCYSYASNLFTPATASNIDGSCATASDWSGNWLNYMTTSRIDALRKVLYGGYRSTDSATQTILERAYIPQDAHSWGKEYTSLAVDGYSISDYTPLDQPATGKRHFFGSLTPSNSKNCSTLDTCSDVTPVLRTRTNVGDNRRIWEWASKERPVLANNLADGPDDGTADDLIPADAEVDYGVRVEVCTASFYDDDECKEYPNKQYKPYGLLHEYGETNRMLFGLLTGSYDNHMSGGRLRKVVSSFANEVDSTTGIFAATKPIVDTFNKLRIRGFNQNSSSGVYWNGNFNDAAKKPSEGQLVDWGNPVGEMLYEASRYFAGKASVGPTAEFNTSTIIDTQVGLPSAVWDDPYSSTSAAQAPQCARASFLTISDNNASFDSDTMPGAYTEFGSFTGDLTGLNASTRTERIGAVESNITGKKFFIGQSGVLADGSPSAKQVDSLAQVRGLPEEPFKQGSYYSAAVAFFDRTTDLRSDLAGTQSIDNYVVALSSPLPKIEAKLPGGKVITLVPFAKTVGGNGVSNLATAYQPTNQIVDFYVTTIANSGTKDIDTTVNGGRYYAEFLINFEDVEQGGDHDMDAISKYVVQANSDDTLSVTVTPTYEKGSMQQNMGYVISGSNADGVYLVARDATGSPGYFLNVPFIDGVQQAPGYCSDITKTGCNNLPASNSTAVAVPTYKFSPSNEIAAGQLKSPLWLAAKYGGFIDRNGSESPDLQVEWDADKNGVPDTYFQVQDPLKLVDSLRKAFDTILERAGSGGNVTASTTSLTTDSLVFQGTYNSADWSGDLEAYPITDTGVSATTAWKASEKMPAPDSRNIFYGTGSATTPGKTFQWASLSVVEKTLMEDNEDLLKFIRGDRSKELKNGGTLRDRSSVNILGDIVNSSPKFSKDTDTVFVGANDGMLHAFSSKNCDKTAKPSCVQKAGVEQFAYIPRTILPRLKDLTRVGYKESHKYFVDGELAISSQADTAGKNYLIGTLGRGGKGLFGLDVTDPSTFKASNVLWEYMPTYDLTTFEEIDKDLGYMLGRPIIAKMQDGTWAVIVGNGYGSTNGKAALYIFNLATGALISKLETGVGSDNGLASPGVRLDGSGKAIAIYAGDLKGNVWKFDVSSTSSASWKVANAKAPMFTAKDASGNAQPITAPITMKVNDVTADTNNGKLFVYFGTGSTFQTGDANNTAVQTWYGLIDSGGVIVSDRSAADFKLKERTVTKSGTLAGKLVRVFSEATANDMDGKSGFYMDLPDSKERMVTASNYYKLAEPVLLASSVIPSSDACSAGGSGYINGINAFTGARLTQPLFDVTDNGSFADDVLTGTGGGNVGSVDLNTGQPGEAVLVGDRLVVGGTDARIEDIRINLGLTPITGRLSWREIVID